MQNILAVVTLVILCATAALAANAKAGQAIYDKSCKMRPVKTVSGPAVDDLIAYVRSLKK